MVPNKPFKSFTNDTNSSLTPVSFGVLQGSVLGPPLFLIYINDLPSCAPSYICLLADDCVIYREITEDKDMRILQADIEAITNWCDIWHMELNSAKCKLMRLSR